MKILRLVFTFFILTSLFPSPVHAAKIISGITVTASAQYTPDLGPDKVLDGNPATVWNAGNYAPQWIRLDLGQNRSINQINLLTSQSPEGLTSHTISLSPDLTSTSATVTIDQFTRNNQWIHIPFPEVKKNIRYITIKTTRSPSSVSWKEIEIYEGATVAPQHLKYFGYFEVDGIPPPNYTNYIPEIDTMHNSNVGEIAVGDERYGNDDTKVPVMLAAMRQYHIKAIIKVWGLFFGTDFKLRSDWETKWQRFQNQIKGYEHDIYAFYFDEPMAIGLPKDAFLMVTARIRQDYPNHALMIIESGQKTCNPPIDVSYYTHATDIGFDYYYTVGNESWDNYAQCFDRFYQNFSDRKVWLIPDGIAKNTTQMATWTDVYTKYYSLALSTDNVVGMLNFLWPPLKVLEPAYQYTLRDALLPSTPTYNSSLRALHEYIGQTIITNNLVVPTQTPSTTPKSGDLNGDRKVDIFDYNILVGNFGKTGTPGWIKADINKNGQVDIFDYNILVENFGK